ncbi:MAG: S4 domain-containing protein [Vicinamibacteria bacterium]
MVKRRSLAKELCDEGAILVNGRTARAGRELALGDEVTLNLRNRLLSVSVADLPAHSVSAAGARELYRVICDEKRGGEPDGAI